MATTRRSKRPHCSVFCWLRTGRRALAQATAAALQIAQKFAASLSVLNVLDASSLSYRLSPYLPSGQPDAGMLRAEHLLAKITATWASKPSRRAFPAPFIRKRETRRKSSSATQTARRPSLIVIGCRGLGTFTIAAARQRVQPCCPLFAPLRAGDALNAPKRKILLCRQPLRTRWNRPKLCPKRPRSSPFWSLSGDALLGQLQSSLQGLTGEEAGRRLEANAGSRLGGRQQTAPFVLLLSQFKSPIILLLLFAAGLSMFLGEHTEALIIFFIVFVSGLLGFWQEHGAANAVAKLLAVVQIKSERAA